MAPRVVQTKKPSVTGTSKLSVTHSKKSSRTRSKKLAEARFEASSSTKVRSKESSIKVKKRNYCHRFLRPFYLTGPFNYAFIYGSWEVIRARKVGTTHTRLDYVVYRFFYPVLLTGACLFGLVAERQLGIFFCLMEVWCMILHLAYAVIFIQNVLSFNVYRPDVKDKQKIPERLEVTDEIVRGGHKFYIYKRYSILPTEELYHNERIIYLLFNLFASVNLTIMVAHIFHLIQWNYPHDEEWEQLRTHTMGIFALLDVFLTPIPLRLAHVIYPLSYCICYGILTYIMYLCNGLVLYTRINWEEDVAKAFRWYGSFTAVVVIVHFILCGLSHFRDFIISHLDDSRTDEKQQALRNQRRLARRKLMSYIEGPDGRIVGISIDRRTEVPPDEVIRTEADEQELSSTTSSESEGKAPATRKELMVDSILITEEIKPPPEPRYKIPPSRALFSSSSSDEEMKKADVERMGKLKDIRFPTPPRGSQQKDQPHPSPSQKLGLYIKPRDSKEAIHRKRSGHMIRSPSPPTPPLIKLVETMIKAQEEGKPATKQVKLLGPKDNPESPPPPPPPKPREIDVSGSIHHWGDNYKSGGDIEGQPYSDFHSELVKKLQAELQARRDSGKYPQGPPPSDRKRLHKTFTQKIRSILKERTFLDDQAKQESERRKMKLLQRRNERQTHGVQGQPVYDPLEEPDIDRTTTFHFIGAKLRAYGEAEVARSELGKFRNHPGVSTVDNTVRRGSKDDGVEPVKSTVAFHPIVQYFDVDEKQPPPRKEPESQKKK